MTQRRHQSTLVPEQRDQVNTSLQGCNIRTTDSPVDTPLERAPSRSHNEEYEEYGKLKTPT